MLSRAATVAAILALVAACSSGPPGAYGPSAVPSAVPSATTNGRSPALSGISHVVVVWMENREASSVTPSSMPYLHELARTYGRADAFFAVTHPSLPNYLALWSGSTQGVSDDGTYDLAGPSLSSQASAAGRSWRIYAQDYPASPGCHTGPRIAGAPTARAWPGPTPASTSRR